MQLKSLFVSAAAVMSLNTVANAQDIEVANGFYAQRENSPENIQKARDEYFKVLTAPGTPNGVKVIAGQQLGRLAVYQGEMLTPKTDKETRQTIFKECWEKFLPKIDPAVVGPNPAYHYYKGVCLAYWGEVVDVFSSMQKVPELLGLITSGSKPENNKFEGGGVYRLASGVHQNKKAQPLGLYKPEQALTEIRQALATPRVGNLDGKDFWENRRGEVLALIELGKTAEACTLTKSLHDAQKTAIEDDELPEGREPESRWVQQALEKDAATISCSLD